MVVNGMYVSEWDDGVSITTDCKVDTDTKTVFNIGMVEVEGLDVFNSEHVCFYDPKIGGEICKDVYLDEETGEYKYN